MIISSVWGSLQRPNKPSLPTNSSLESTKRIRNQRKLSRDYVEGPKPYQLIKRRLIWIFTYVGGRSYYCSCLGGKWSHCTENRWAPRTTFEESGRKPSKKRQMDRSAFRSGLISKPCQPSAVGCDYPRQSGLIPSYHLCVILAPAYRFCQLHGFLVPSRRRIQGNVGARHANDTILLPVVIHVSLGRGFGFNQSCTYQNDNLQFDEESGSSGEGSCV